MLVKLKFSEITDKTLDILSLLQTNNGNFKIRKKKVGIKIRLIEFLNFGLTAYG